MSRHGLLLEALEEVGRFPRQHAVQAFGRPYLSNATCLIRLHLFSTALITYLIRQAQFAALFKSAENMR